MEVVMKSKLTSLSALLLLALSSTYGLAQDRVGSSEIRPLGPPSTAQAEPAAAPSPGSPHDLLIGAGDLLEISLYGMPDFKTDVRVNSGGEISLPMLGAVAVSGLSVEQAQLLIEHKLSEKGLFNDPHVTVFVKEYATQGISVLGEVQKPGIYPLLGERKLYDAISAAGGTTPKAGRYAMVTRRGDPQHPLQVPLLAGADSMKNNVTVEPGDTIMV